MDEKASKAECLARCKAAYAAKFYGTSKEVLEGRAEAILRKSHGQPDPKFPANKGRGSAKIPDWAKAGDEAKTGAEEKGEGSSKIEEIENEDDENEMTGAEADEGDQDEEEVGYKRRAKEEVEDEEEEEEVEKGKGKGKKKKKGKK